MHVPGRIDTDSFGYASYKSGTTSFEFFVTVFVRMYSEEGGEWTDSNKSGYVERFFNECVCSTGVDEHAMINQSSFIL